MRVLPTDRKATVRLTMAQWNTLLVMLMNSYEHDMKQGYKALAQGNRRDVYDAVRDQIEAKVDQAFAKEFPDTCGILNPS